MKKTLAGENVVRTFFLLKKKHKDKVRLLAKQKGVSESEFVRQMIEEYK